MLFRRPYFWVLGLLFPSMALGASIFLNGVNIDGAVSQSFDNCQVTIDAQGNLHITCKPASASTPTPPPTNPPTNVMTQIPQALTRQYWLVTEKAAPGMSQYDIDLFINGKWVRKFLDSEEHVYLDVSKYVVVGNNRVQFVAKKNLGDVRRSSSPQHFFRIVIGEGQSGGRTIVINKKFIDYKRTALETKDFTDSFTLVAQ